MTEVLANALADFHEPPVVETVLSVQFESLPKLTTLHLGLFWQKVKARFPDVEEKAPLSPVKESFANVTLGMPRLRFEVIDEQTPPRLWLMNRPGTEMIQIQNDRFIKNWRKQGEDDMYPHYEPVIRPAFERDYRQFQAFLDDEQLGGVEVNQCEVTYVNHIVSGRGWERFDEIGKIFSFWNQTPAQVPGMPEDLSLHLRFPIREGLAAPPVGRLHVDIQPAIRTSDAKPMYVMNLTARGLCNDPLAFFDIGRRWIVKSFERLTTEHMHSVWRKK